MVQNKVQELGMCERLWKLLWEMGFEMGKVDIYNHAHINDDTLLWNLYIDDIIFGLKWEK